MAKQFILASTTSFTAYARITDNNGSPITGLAYNSTNVVGTITNTLLSKYIIVGATSSTITLATQSATGTWSTGGFCEMDSTAFPGLYRLDVPNAVFATTSGSTYISLYGYTNMAATIIEYELVAFNPQNSTNLGLTLMPSNVTQWIGTAPLGLSSQQVQAVIPTTSTISAVTGTVTATVPGNVGGVTGTVTATVPTAVSLAATQTFNNTGTWTGNITGSVGSVTGTVTATVPTQVAANVTDWLGTAPLALSGQQVQAIIPVTSTISAVTGTVTATIPTTLAVNVTTWAGTAVATPNVGGVPKVDIVDWLGTAPLSLSSQQVQAIIPVTSTISSVTGTITSTVVGTVTATVPGAVGSVTAPVSLGTGQLALRKDTQITNFMFPMFGTSGTGMTGLTVSATRSLDGATFAACANSVSEVGNGWYSITLATTDTNCNVLALRFSASGALDTDFTILTQS